MKHGNDYHWIIRITLISIVTSMVFSFVSSEVLDGAGYAVAALLLILFIIIGIVFDMLGVAVTSAQEAPFHSMASHREYGAKSALKLVRRSDRVASICNDVVGDISGIVSGATAAVIAGNISRDAGRSSVVTQLLVTGLVAGLTIGGKACGKAAALNRNVQIVLLAGKVSAFFTGEKGRSGGKKREK